MISNLIKWLRSNKFEAHTIAFLLMILPCVPLYSAANAGQTALIGLLIGLIVLGNLLAILIH